MVQNLFIPISFIMIDLSPASLQLIDTASALLELIPILEPKTHLCIDTEFHAENRYLPKLMLLQIADLERNTWVIDPLRVDISPLHSALKEKTLVMHGCTEDLRLIQSHLGFSPSKIFDTQIAAALQKIYYPTSLNGLLNSCFTDFEPQHQGLTDWSKRPLSDHQIQYAANDASSLAPLFLFFQDKLQNRQDQLWNICAEFAREVLNPRPNQEWLTWGVTKTLSPCSINILHELLQWREQQAQKQNKPANYILPRKIAIDIAKRQPSSIQVLRQNRRMHGVLIKKHGNSILQCVQKGKKASHQFHPLSTENIRLAEVLRTWAQAIAVDLSIDANLLLPSDLSLQISYSGLDALFGWRKELLFDPMREFLAGNTNLQMIQQQIRIT